MAPPARPPLSSSPARRGQRTSAGGQSRATGLAAALATAVGFGLLGCPGEDPYRRGTAPTAATPRPTDAPTPPPGEVGDAPADSLRKPPPTGDRPAPTVDPSDVPAALRPASPIVHAFYAALSAVDAGDRDAMDPVMLPRAPWLTPGEVEGAPIAGMNLARAMAPWSGPAVHPNVRRVVDLGAARVLVLLNVSADDRPGSDYELALVLDGKGDRISSIRHYGDPLGPVSARPEDAGRTLDLGPTDPPVLDRGEPTVHHVAVVRSWRQALASRAPAKARATLADDVVLHDVTRRRTTRGAAAMISAFSKALGDDGALEILHEHATASMVMVEGAIYGLHTDADGHPVEHGVLDLYRLRDGVIVEAWRFLNRRGRPHLGERRALARP